MRDVGFQKDDLQLRFDLVHFEQECFDAPVQRGFIHELVERLFDLVDVQTELDLFELGEDAVVQDLVEWQAFVGVAHQYVFDQGDRLGRHGFELLVVE